MNPVTSNGFGYAPTHRPMLDVSTRCLIAMLANPPD